MEGFVAKIDACRPQWVAFHGKTAARVVSHALGRGRKLALGRQSWTVADCSVFVVPSASGSNRDPKRLEGQPGRVDWFRELAALID